MCVLLIKHTTQSAMMHTTLYTHTYKITTTNLPHLPTTPFFPNGQHLTHHHYFLLFFHLTKTSTISSS